MENDIKLLYLIFDIKNFYNAFVNKHTFETINGFGVEKCIDEVLFNFITMKVQNIRSRHIAFHHNVVPSPADLLTLDTRLLTRYTQQLNLCRGFGFDFGLGDIEQLRGCSLIVNNEITKPTIFRYKHSLAQVVIITEREWFSCVWCGWRLVQMLVAGAVCLYCSRLGPLHDQRRPAGARLVPRTGPSCGNFPPLLCQDTAPPHHSRHCCC